jgi:hypothetical protein
MRRLKQNIERHIEEQILVLKWKMYTILVNCYNNKKFGIFDDCLSVLQPIFMA